MTAGRLLTLNFEEVRRRSIKVWRAIPPERLAFKVDPECHGTGRSIPVSCCATCGSPDASGRMSGTEASDIE
jgi:hypothetical protein